MQQTHPRRGRTPGRRFLALSSDALYTSQPPRRLEATAVSVDPPELVEIIGAAVSLRDEPECVGGAILDSYGADAWFFQSARHEAAVLEQRELRRALPVEDRVRDCWARAKEQHRQDLRGELLALDKAVARARRAQPAKLGLVDGAGGKAQPALRPASRDLLQMARAEFDERLQAAASFTVGAVERSWLVIPDGQLDRLERVEAELDRAPDVLGRAA